MGGGGVGGWVGCVLDYESWREKGEEEGKGERRDRPVGRGSQGALRSGSLLRLMNFTYSIIIGGPTKEEGAKKGEKEKGEKREEREGKK